MTTLSYYSDIFSQKPNEFITFCDKYYSTNYLQDYIHIICIHKNDIIKDETKNETCTMVSGCLSTTRHYRDRTTNKDIENDNNNETPHLCVDIFDSLHFYMYHMEECGLRISINIDDIKDIDDSDHSNCKDKIIAITQNEIQKRKTKCGLFKRLNNTKHSKFNIMLASNDNINDYVVKTDEKKEITESADEQEEKMFTNDMLDHIASLDIKKNIVTGLKNYLVGEEYDTDSIKNYIDIYEDE
eukprot:498459_1